MKKIIALFKQNTILMADLVSVIVAYFFSILIRFDFSLNETDFQGFTAEHYLQMLVKQSWIIILVYLIIFKIFKLDKTIQGLASVYEATRVIIAASLGAVIFFLIAYTGLIPRFRFGIYPIQTLFLIMFLEFTRFYKRMTQMLKVRTKSHRQQEHKTKSKGAVADGS